MHDSAEESSDATVEVVTSDDPEKPSRDDAQEGEGSDAPASAEDDDPEGDEAVAEELVTDPATAADSDEMTDVIAAAVDTDTAADDPEDEILVGPRLADAGAIAGDAASDVRLETSDEDQAVEIDEREDEVDASEADVAFAKTSDEAVMDDDVADGGTDDAEAPVEPAASEGRPLLARESAHATADRVQESTPADDDDSSGASLAIPVAPMAARRVLPWLGWRYSLVLVIALVALAGTFVANSLSSDDLFALRVVDAATGKPISHAQVSLGTVVYETNEVGEILVVFPTEATEIVVAAEGYQSVVGELATGSRPRQQVELRAASE